MFRRLPTAILVIAGLLSSVAYGAGEPARPSIMSVTLTGGFSYRDTTYQAGSTQAQTTQIRGTSPWLVRLRTDWFLLPWLGIEGEGTGDFFRAIKPDTTRLPTTSLRGSGRLGVSLRWLTEGGFLLSGSVGYGLSLAPVIRIATAGGAPFAGGLFSHGPMVRVGVGYSGERFEGLAGATLMFALGAQVNSLEPHLWLGGRLADLGPMSLWAGLDGAILLEDSPTAVGYSGPTLRMGLGLKLQLLPPAPPPKPVIPEVVAADTTVRVQVLLPDGPPALGALVTLDQAAPAQVDAKGELVVKVKPGAHSAGAKLSGYRGATATAQALEGKETLLPIRLEALTGPGQLSGIVRSSATAAPVADATVTAGDLPPVQTGEDGTYRFDSLGPGPVQVRIEAQGFNAADEIAQIPPESAATLDVQLEQLGKGSPATVRGLVRSRTGEALKARVTIKGLPTKVTVTPEGRFFVTVPGGTYLFVISAKGYATQTKKVVLADGDQAIVHTELHKASR